MSLQDQVAAAAPPPPPGPGPASTSIPGPPAPRGATGKGRRPTSGSQAPNNSSGNSSGGSKANSSPSTRSPGSKRQGQQPLSSPSLSATAPQPIKRGSDATDRAMARSVGHEATPATNTMASSPLSGGNSKSKNLQRSRRLSAPDVTAPAAAATPQSTQLYAGATFQNSPAASNLPIPVFASRPTSAPRPLHPHHNKRDSAGGPNGAMFAMDNDLDAPVPDDAELRQKSRDLMRLLSAGPSQPQQQPAAAAETKLPTVWTPQPQPQPHQYQHHHQNNNPTSQQPFGPQQHQFQHLPMPVSLSYQPQMHPLPPAFPPFMAPTPHLPPHMFVHQHMPYVPQQHPPPPLHPFAGMQEVGTSGGDHLGAMSQNLKELLKIR